MLKQLLTAALVAVTCPVVGKAQMIDRGLAGAEVRTPLAADPIDKLVAAKPDLRDPAQQRALLASIDDWLSQELGLPPSEAFPKIAFATPSDMVRRRYRIIRSDAVRSSYDTPAQSSVERTIAIYDIPT